MKPTFTLKRRLQPSHRIPLRRDISKDMQVI